MIKTKFFKADESNSDKVSEFLGGVNVVQDGFMLSDGWLCVMYRERNDFRADKATLLSDISREIIQAERNLTKNANSLKYHTKLLASKMAKMERLSKEVEEISREIEEHEAGYDISVSKRANDIRSRLGELQANYKKKGVDSLDKAAVEKEAFELSSELKEIESVSNEYEENYQKELTRLKNEISNKNVSLVNLSGEIKEERLHIETVEETINENMISIEASLEYYKEIEASRN